MTKTAFITGITGQDGSYLTEHLLSQGYTVHGLVRRNSNTVRSRIDHLTRDESIYAPDYVRGFRAALQHSSTTLGPKARPF